MPAAKKRKVTATSSHSTRDISTFTKVSKPQVASKSVLEKTAPLESNATSKQDQNTDIEKKRKLCTIEDIKATANHILNATVNQTPTNTRALSQQQLVDSKRILRTPKKTVQVPNLLLSTPTKGARVLLDNLLLSPSSPLKISSSSLDSDILSLTEIRSCKSIAKVCLTESRKGELPTELLDLIHLHSSFLTALSLHYAHNGTHTPADLRALCPDVARVWGKRKVIVEDIQRTLGILNSTHVKQNGSQAEPSAELKLSNYGHGKVCIEIKMDGCSIKFTKPLDEVRLSGVFVRNLRKFWEEQENMEASPADFIRSLPLEHIITCSSLTKMTSLLGKGQRRLADLKSSIAHKGDAERNKATITSIVVKETGRKPTLLERLKAKELRQSILPTPPTKAELARKAALQRLEEVIRVLSLLATSTSIGQQRVSFTMPTVLGKLRDSFKTPMSKEEGEMCIRLLASDIAPEWLKVVKMGKSNAIVVNRDNRPSDLDIQKRVKLAI